MLVKKKKTFDAFKVYVMPTEKCRICNIHFKYLIPLDNSIVCEHCFFEKVKSMENYKKYCCVCDKEIEKENKYCEGWNWICGKKCYKIWLKWEDREE